MDRKPQTMEDVSKELKKVIEFINSRSVESIEYDENDLEKTLDELRKENKNEEEDKKEKSKKKF